MPAIKYDIYNEQFDAFFVEKIKNMTQIQREKIPDDLLFKLFRKNESRIFDLSHKEKEYILAVAFGMKVTIVLEDEVNGIGPKDYRDAADAQKAKITNQKLLEKPGVHASFVRANKELFNSLTYISHVHNSEINKLIRMLDTKYVTHTQNKIAESKRGFIGLVNLFTTYEQRKKTLVARFEMPLSEIYAILYFSTGEKLAKQFYDKDFINAYSCNRRSLSQALTDLNRKGLLDRRGGMKMVRYSLSTKGIELLDRIIKQIITFYNNPL